MSTATKVLQYLERFELQGKAPKYTANSPLRPGSNSHAFSVVIEDDEHGAYHDFVTGEQGSLYELAKLLNIDTPKREQVENSKRSYATLAEYALLKGVPEKVFSDAHWEVHTYFDQRPCFKFPTAGGERYRFTDGLKPTFKSITGFQTCWYGLTRAIQLAGKQSLILCNGEPSTIVAQHFGLPAFCMPGGENQNPTQDMLTQLKKAWKGNVRLAMDCDETGKNAVKKFSEAFKSVGIGYTIIDLMLTDKGDLADFCKLHHDNILTAFDALSHVRVYDLPEKPADVTDLVKVGRELMNLRKNGDGSSLDQALDLLQAEINHLRPNKGSVITFEQVSVEYEQWVRDNLKTPGIVKGFKSGMTKFDELVGGLDRGMMCGVLAETGMGKTTFIGSITSNLINQAKGLVIPTEMRARDWWNQIVAYRTQIPKHLMRQGRLEPNQAGLVFSTNALLQEQQCKVIECQNPTANEILKTAREAMNEIGIEWIVLDSLSNVKSSANDSIFNTVSEAADCAQELARMGLMVLFTSQVGRSLDDRKSRMPTLHDGKGSGRIEENADVMLSLYNHDNLVKQGIKEPMIEFPSGTIAVRCLKHRMLGDVECKLVQLKFKGGVGVTD